MSRTFVERIVSARALFFGAALLLLIASPAFAGGYQRTKDGKTLVWNNDPRPNDQAIWSGKRDDDGYATGSGTLTWYRVQHKIVTGSNLPIPKPELISRYTGEMVHGKLNGMVVATDANGKIYHGKFVDGHKGGSWAAGPAPAKEASQPNEPAPARRGELVEAPAEGPPPAKSSAPPEPLPPKQETTKSADTPPDAGQHPTEFDDSLRSLVGPPTSLNKAGAPAPSSSPAAKAAASPAAPSKSEATATPGELDIKLGVSPPAEASASPFQQP